MNARERDILHAELRGSTTEFMGWLTGMKPPEDKEAIPPEMRTAFDRMVDRLQHAVERCADERNATMRAFGASDAACYLWPDDSETHKALRAAYICGAANSIPSQHGTKP